MTIHSPDALPLAALYEQAAAALRDAAHLPDDARLSALADAINAAHARAARPRPFAALSPRKPTHGVLTATRERPALLASARVPWDPAADAPPDDAAAEHESSDDVDPSDADASGADDADASNAANDVDAGDPANDADASDARTAIVLPLLPGAPRPSAEGDAFIVFDPAACPAEPEDVTLNEIVRQCADTVGMLGRHRRERAWREAGEDEAELLAQTDAIAVAGGPCARSLAAWWAEETEAGDEGDPWSPWGAVFALASLEGLDALALVASRIEHLSPDRVCDGRMAAEALLVAPHPHIPELARELAASPNPIARAVGVEVLGRRGLLDPEELRWHLRDPNVPVLRAAILAARTLPAAQGIPLVAPCLYHPAHAVAAPAARRLALWGRPEPLDGIRDERLPALEGDALEILVLLGNLDDLPLFEILLSRAPIGAAELSAVARFGSPRAWALLAHHLADEELADAAERALVTLFGPRVPPADGTNANAWRSAIATAKLDVDSRYRQGEPWTPRVVAGEIRRGELPRDEIQHRLDDLVTHTGITADVDLARWSPDVTPPLEALVARYESTAYPAGTWRTRILDGGR